MMSEVQSQGLKMANTPRPAADGMDSEVLRAQDLKQQQPRHLRIAPPSGSRHRNLNTSPSSTSYSKASSAIYIPHEPVKGAVKPVAQGSSVALRPGMSSSSRSGAFIPGMSGSEVLRPGTGGTGALRPGLNDSGLSLKKSNKDTLAYKSKTSFSNFGLRSDRSTGSPVKIAPIGLSENKISFDQPIKPQMTVAQAIDCKPSGLETKQTVKSIQVPIYDVPGQRSAKTYSMSDKHEKEKQLQETIERLMPNQQDDHVTVNITPAKPITGTEPAISIGTESRSVEGEVTTPADTMRKEIDNLRDQLKSQTKVNGELKKLLVASMGDDLHYRVECLVRTNAQLATEMGLYSNKISQDGENMDQLGIQADLWRSKYHASRVQIEELLAQKSTVMERYEDACTALETLLQERYQLRDSLHNCYRVLQQLSDAFEPLPPTNRPPGYGPKSVTDIAARNCKLADNMKFRLLGAIQLYPGLYNTATPNVMTPAEQLGIEVLSEKSELADEEQQSVALNQQSAVRSADARFSRFNPHPYARYDNITFNCCAQCNGEIKIV